MADVSVDPIGCPLSTPSVAHFHLTYHDNSVHFQAEGYEIVTGCWTEAGDAVEPNGLTAAISDVNYAVFFPR